MPGAPEGLGRIYRTHSSSMLHGTSVDPAVGFEVKAAWETSWCVTVCFKDLFYFKIMCICVSVCETEHMSVEETVRSVGAGVNKHW